MHCIRRLIVSRIKTIDWNSSYCTLPSSSIPKKEVIDKKNSLFLQEQKRQSEEIGRIEKSSVQISGPPEDVVVVINKDISTPYDCCRHISEGLCQQAALALVNDEILWDMHRPLPGNCTVKFLSFKDPDPYSVNKAFWRTGSFVLGAVISRAFKDDIVLHLHSFPPPYIKSGSFVYDAFLNLNNWIPTEDELKVLSAEFLTFVQQKHKIERLRVKKSVAFNIFEDNPFKLQQISAIAAKSEDNLVTLYKVDNHIDISNGPMVADTSFFGRSSVTAAIQIKSPLGLFYRFQGIALPKGILLNSYAYQIIETRGKQLNEADIPGDTNGKMNFYKHSSLRKVSSTNIPESLCEVPE